MRDQPYYPKEYPMPQNVTVAIVVLCPIPFVMFYGYAVSNMHKLWKKREYEYHVKSAMKIANRK